MKKETLFTISQRTGYSVSTVSRVLSGKGERYRICQDTIDYISEVAKAGNYTPNLIAQSLRTRKTNSIGLTVPSIDNPFFSTLAGVIINKLKSFGYNILLSDTMESAENEIEAINSFVSRKVDGIIAVPVGTSPDFLESVAATVPVVLIDRYFSDTSLPYVCTDNYTGGYMGTEYMIGKGCGRLLAIQGVQGSMPNKERVRGFLQAVADHAGMVQSHNVSGDSFSVDNGYRETMAAFSGEEAPPDGIFAFSTTILLGALKAIRELGLRIPDDVALMSFDNNRFLDYLDPSITRVEQPVQMVGKLATDTIVRMIETGGDGAAGESQILIRPSLIKGRSC